MNVQTGAALHLLRSDPDQAEESLSAARDAGRSVLDELRELLPVLRHDDGDDAPTSSLPSIDELAALVDTMRSAGLDVTWTVAVPPAARSGRVARRVPHRAGSPHQRGQARAGMPSSSPSGTTPG